MDRYNDRKVKPKDSFVNNIIQHQSTNNYNVELKMKLHFYKKSLIQNII